MMEPQGQVDHFRALRNDLGAAAKAGKIVTDIAVILLDGKGQILAGEELVFGDETMKAVPVVGQEGVTLDADFIEKLLAEPAPAKAGVASSRRPRSPGRVRRWTGSNACQGHILLVFV